MSESVMLDPKTTKKILEFQKSEITEHVIYERLSRSVKEPQNREVLKKISGEELGHYHFWKKLTGCEVAPDRFKAGCYVFLSKLLGLTFGLKLMERGEDKAQVSYHGIISEFPNAKFIEQDEAVHEKQLLNMLDEERLRYVGSAVLGLNDALVELTGALAGFTLALQNSRLIAAVGLITGIAASLSMAASEYLSTKTEGGKNPAKAALYTGTAYVFAVFCLILPFLVLDRVYFSLAWSLINVVLIILAFTFYTSVAKDLPFRKRFLEMLGISLGVATLTFGIGYIIRFVFNVEV